MKRIIFTAIILAYAMVFQAQTNVTQVEYFIDADNGMGLNTILDIDSPNTDITQTVLADIPASTEVGYHKLYFRVKDENGHWSHTIRKHIEVVAAFAERHVVLGEYFIDEDPEVGTATPFSITPQETDIEQAFTAQILENVPIGYHKLYGRVKDNYGHWSHTFRKHIQVYLNPDTNIVEIEYFFGDDMAFGSNTIVDIDEPSADGTRNFYVPYPEGNYDFNDKLFVRAKDGNDRWAITAILDEIDEALGIGNITANTWVKVFPNPTHGTVYISTTSEITSTVIHDLTGKTVYRSKENLRQINIEQLPSGLYLLNLTTDRGNASYKLVKQ